MNIPTLVEVLRSNADERGDKVAFAYLADDDSIDHTATFSQLDRMARGVAAQLQERDAFGKRILLLYPPGIEFIAAFMGCLYAGAVAVPSYPPLPSRLDRSAASRLSAIVRDSTPALALTTTVLEARALALFDEMGKGNAPECLVPGLVDDSRALSWVRPGIDTRSTAFLQYTSGTTAPPKGVPITHANALHNLGLLDATVKITDDDVGVNWLPPYHDMGLIGGVLQPIYKATSVTLMSPISFLQRPIRWLETISRVRATISGGPNFAYEHCVKRISSDQKAGLDLSCWRVAMNGADDIKPATLEAFSTAFAECGFSAGAWSPCYGMAEATVFVCGGPRGDQPLWRSFDADALELGHAVEPSGEGSRVRHIVPMSDGEGALRVEIVDVSTGTPLSAGNIGEIWVQGGSVAREYWNNETATEHYLRAHLGGNGPFFRTGDLGFVLSGELSVVGRIADQILIGSRSLSARDIEAAAEASDLSLRPNGAAAFVVDTGKVVVLCEVDRQSLGKIDTAAVIDAIRSRVAWEHQVNLWSVVLLKPGAIPKTSSGKTQRFACRDLFVNGGLEPVATWTVNV